MKKLFVILNIIFFYSITLYSQCAIKEEILSKSSFECPDVPEQYFSQQIYSFCQDSESEYHFVFFSLPDEISYSIIFNNNTFYFQSKSGNLSLSKYQQDRLKALLLRVPLNKRYVQNCIEEVQFGGHVIEFSGFKINGEIQLVYWSARNNGERIIEMNDDRLMPLVNLLNYLKKMGK